MKWGKPKLEVKVFGVCQNESSPQQINSNKVDESEGFLNKFSEVTNIWQSANKIDSHELETDKTQIPVTKSLSSFSAGQHQNQYLYGKGVNVQVFPFTERQQKDSVGQQIKPSPDLISRLKALQSEDEEGSSKRKLGSMPSPTISKLKKIGCARKVPIIANEGIPFRSLESKATDSSVLDSAKRGRTLVLMSRQKIPLRLKTTQKIQQAFTDTNQGPAKTPKLAEQAEETPRNLPTFPNVKQKGSNPSTQQITELDEQIKTLDTEKPKVLDPKPISNAQRQKNAHHKKDMEMTKLGIKIKLAPEVVPQRADRKKENAKLDAISEEQLRSNTVKQHSNAQAEVDGCSGLENKKNKKGFAGK